MKRTGKVAQGSFVVLCWVRRILAVTVQDNDVMISIPSQQPGPAGKRQKTAHLNDRSTAIGLMSATKSVTETTWYVKPV